MPGNDTVNVLVVDDDRSTQRLLDEALKKQGFTVTVERDGEWAVKTFDKKHFEVVVVDLLLPALNGYEVAKHIRESQNPVPVVMISGVYKNAIHQREAVQKHGALAFLEKPLDLHKLYDTLRKALGDRYPAPRPPQPPPPPIDEDEVTGEYMADVAQREEVQVVEQQVRQEKAAPAGPSVRGDFATRPFAEVLAEIYRWRASGALLLRRSKVKKIVYFRGGTPEVVKSNLLVECLGRILVREKMISESECEVSLRTMKASGRMQGTTLIEMGCISPHNLQYALHLQLQEKLYDAFRWDTGEYQFNAKAGLPPEPVSLGLTTAQLILEGVKRTYDERRLAKVFSGVDRLYVHHSEDPLYALQDAGLENEEKELMGMADGHKTVATLRALELLPPLDTDRVLFAMKCAQMISLQETAAEGKPKASMARLADLAAGPTEIVPPPLPPPAMPPPLPPRSTVDALPLPMPWDDARLSAAPPQAMPPPPPVETPVDTPAVSTTVPRGPLLPELSTGATLNRMTGEEGVLRERLASKVSTMRRQDYFEVLGVRANAAREEIKRAYFALAKEFHPDKHFHSSSAEVRELAQQVYDLVSLAHDTLTDPLERERYVKELAQGLKRDLNEDVGKILAAEGKFQKGEEFMRQRDYAAALKQFTDAIGLYADEGEFHAWQGWALFQLDASRTEESVVAIEKAISLNPKLDKSYLFLGYIQKATGRPDKAEKQFEKAIQCNPDCTEALRELRLLGKQRK